MITIPHDKALHALGGVAIFAAANALFGPVWALWWAAAIGAAKELIWDGALNKGTVDSSDFTATAAGGLLGWLCHLPPC